MASHDSADVIAALGRPLPAAVIGELTGVPATDRHFLHEYSDLVVAAVQEQDPELQQVAIDRVAEFDEYFLDVIRARREATDRPDDAMTALIDYRDEDGVGLSDEKVLLHLSKDLITGGIDTTTHLVGNMFYDLLSTPGASTSGCGTTGPSSRPRWRSAFATARSSTCSSGARPRT